jgi:Bacteriophage lambda head decoration protein D
MTSVKETLHPGAAILSEANGQLSRDNVNIPVGQKFPAGTLIVISTGIPLAAGGTGPIGYSIYGVDTTVQTGTGAAMKTACVVRDAELNRQCIAWPAGFTDANKDAAAVETAKTFLIIRGAALPSPTGTTLMTEGEEGFSVEGAAHHDEHHPAAAARHDEQHAAAARKPAGR